MYEMLFIMLCLIVMDCSCFSCKVLNGAAYEKYRLWAAAIFSYVFAAYFCQLLYAEYNNFSIRRLQYLVQADPDSALADPDTPPQTYYTVMVERIPPHLKYVMRCQFVIMKLIIM